MTRSPRRNRPRQLPRHILRLWSHGIHILTHAQRSPRHPRHDIPRCKRRNQRYRRRMVHVPLRVCNQATPSCGLLLTNDSDKITMWILPHELREKIWTHGWFFLACLVGTEVFSLLAPARFFRVWPLSRLTKMDHAAHLGGYLAGAGCGYTLMQKRERERKERASKWI